MKELLELYEISEKLQRNITKMLNLKPFPEVLTKVICGEEIRTLQLKADILSELLECIVNVMKE